MATGMRRPSNSCTRRSSISTARATCFVPTPLGTRLALEPLLGTGTVRLALKKAAAAELHATLVGRDGSAFGLTGDEAATVPVGEYRLGTVTATYSDPQGGQSWSFIFSDNGAKPDPKWYSLGKDGQLNLDPIGTLEMELSITDKAKTAKAGEDIALQPLLYTGDGLLINVGYRGNPVSPSAQENLAQRSPWRRPTARPWPRPTRALPEARSARPRFECPSRSPTAPFSFPSNSTPAPWPVLSVPQPRWRWSRSREPNFQVLWNAAPLLTLRPSKPCDVHGCNSRYAC